MNTFLIQPLGAQTFATIADLTIAIDQRLTQLNRSLMPVLEYGAKLAVTTSATSGGGLVIATTGIADYSIEGIKLVDEAVNARIIADNAVTTAKILDAAISTLKIANNAVTEALVASNAITTTKIADDAITTAKLVASSITSAKIAAGTILASNIAANTITAAQIAALTITAGEIAANAITTSKINAGAVVASSIAAGTITTNELNAASINGIQLTLSSTGHIKGGQTAYDTGSGFFLGYSTAAYKLSIGASAGGKLTWDGSTLAVAGFTINASTLSAGSGASAIQLSSAGQVLMGDGTSTTNTALGYSGFALGHSSGGNNHKIFLGHTGTSSDLYLYNSAGTATVSLVGSTGAIACSAVSCGAVTASGDVNAGGYNMYCRVISGSTGDHLYLGAGGSSRWSISDSSGDLIVRGAYSIKKLTSDGWTPKLVDGTASIEFQASGGQIYGRINGGAAVLLG